MLEHRRGQPIRGPHVLDHYEQQRTRAAYSLHDAVEELQQCVDFTGCHLCYLILSRINAWENRPSKTVEDDWEILDGDFEAGDEEIESERSDRHVVANHSNIAANAQTSDSKTTESAIVLDFTFRHPVVAELDTRCTDVDVQWKTRTDGIRQTIQALSLAFGLPSDVVDLCQKRDLRDDSTTGSSWCTELARMWLHKCNTTHPICLERTKLKRTKLPTRVIDVGSEYHRPRLIVTNSADAGEYVCLSHCWGKSQPFKTEKSDLKDRLSGFDLEVMPKTFRDAIVTCRNLGMQYLWIDSLCIIQDSADDWAKESAMMGNIYRDASLTIFAEYADSDADGCFAVRNGMESALCRTPMLDKLASRFNIMPVSRPQPTFIQAKLHHATWQSMPEKHHIFETVRNLDHRSDKSLNSRGWVVQESILSFRSLIYDQYEIRWNCAQMKACECSPEGHIRKTWRTMDKASKRVFSDVNELEMFNSWSYIIQEFTSRKLTIGKDKLPALAGLATEMMIYNKSQYLAGMWHSTLRKDLAWSVAPNGNSTPFRFTTRPAGYRAPSWSWASVDGKIRPAFDFTPVENLTTDEMALDKRLTDICCKIQDCVTEPSNTLNPFGELSHGVLTLRGRLILARCANSVTNFFHADRFPVINLKTKKEVGWLDLDFMASGSPSNVGYMWCMPLYSYLGDLKILALVLTTSTHSKTFKRPAKVFPYDIFVRIGLVTRKAPSQAQGALQFLSWFEDVEELTITIL